jgi:hypothetical protein
MPPVFFSGNVIAITLKFTWMVHTSFAIMRPFWHKVFIIFNTLLPMLSKKLHTTVVKFLALTLEQNLKTVSIHCLQNGVHVVHPLRSQTGRNWRMPDVGCEQDGHEWSVPFFQLPCVRKLVCIVAKEKDAFLFWQGQTQWM